MNFQKGISPLLSIIVIVLIVVIGILIWQSQGTKEKVISPAGEQEEITGQGENEIQDETADWENYRNSKYGFEVKYPSEWEQVIEKDHIGFFDPKKTSFETPNELGIRIYSKIGDRPLNEWVQELETVKSETKIQGKAPSGKFQIINNSTFYLIDLINFMSGNNVANAFIEKNGLVIRFRKDLLAEDGRDIFNQILSTFKFID